MKIFFFFGRFLRLYKPKGRRLSAELLLVSSARKSTKKKAVLGAEVAWKVVVQPCHLVSSATSVSLRDLPTEECPPRRVRKMGDPVHEYTARLQQQVNRRGASERHNVSSQAKSERETSRPAP